MDATLGDLDVRDAAQLEDLQQRLDAAIAYDENSVQNLEQAEFLLSAATEETEAIELQLAGVHRFWHYKNSVQTVTNRETFLNMSCRGLFHCVKMV